MLCFETNIEFVGVGIDQLMTGVFWQASCTSELGISIGSRRAILKDASRNPRDHIVDVEVIGRLISIKESGYPTLHTLRTRE